MILLAHATLDLWRKSYRHESQIWLFADNEIRNVIRILSRKTKNNPVLIGEPGYIKQQLLKDWHENCER